MSHNVEKYAGATPALPPAQPPMIAEKSGLNINQMYITLAGFEMGQRIASALSRSDMLPKAYQGNVANCMLLLTVASRFSTMGIDPVTVAQNLVPVHGKYSWQGQFITAIINMSGRFYEPIQFEKKTDPKDNTKTTACRAFTFRKNSDGTKGIRVDGAWVTWETVTAEGWNRDKTDKNGGTVKSKWNTMGELMFTYRSASWFSREHCPDLLMGYPAADEVEDVDAMKDVTPKPIAPIAEMQQAAAEKPAEAEAVVAAATSAEVVQDEPEAVEEKREEPAVTEQPQTTMMFKE